jgi:hypothetical protein
MEPEHARLIVSGIASWAGLIAGLCTHSWRSALLYGLGCFVIIVLIGVLAGLLPRIGTQSVSGYYNAGWLVGKITAAIALPLLGHAIRRAVIWVYRKLRGPRETKTIPAG